MLKIRLKKLNKPKYLYKIFTNGGTSWKYIRYDEEDNSYEYAFYNNETQKYDEESHSGLDKEQYIEAFIKNNNYKEIKL